MTESATNHDLHGLREPNHLYASPFDITTDPDGVRAWLFAATRI